MIPKIAHFHWQGEPMNWLRWASVRTFEKLNPDWEIRLLRSCEESKRASENYAHQADWSWWKALRDHGGLQVATDIVFVRPIPEEWLDCNLTACLNGTNAIFQFAALGCAKGHHFMRDCLERCMIIAPTASGYQPYGVNLLNRVCVTGNNWRLNGFRDMPMEAFCKYDEHDTEVFWGHLLGGSQPIEIEGGMIGVHWYGGHDRSRECEPLAGRGSDYPIVRLAEEVLC